MQRLAGLFFFVLSWIPGLAQAAASPPEPIPVPSPGIEVEGVARAEVTALEVRCDRSTLVEITVRCAVVASVELTATEPCTVAPQAGTAPGEILLEGAPLDGPIEFLEGQRARLTVRFEAVLTTETRSSTQFWSMSPIRARHFFLGESADDRRFGDDVFGELVRGPQVTLAGETRVAVDAAGLDVVFGGVAVAGAAREGEGQVTPAHAGLALTLAVEERSPTLLQHGGPVLSLGARFSMSREDDLRFLLRVSYELGLADYVVLSASFESDFESILESAVIEVGSPELIILIPGIAAGIGVVARQLGNRDADAALRLRFGANILAAGLTADFDYWPTIGEWTASMVGRISF